MGKGSNTTTQKADPWSGIQPALTQLYDSALGNYNNFTPQFYPGRTVAPQSPTTQLAQSYLYGRANAGSPVNAAGQNQALATLGGNYLGSNNPYAPGLSAVADKNVSSVPGFSTLQNIGAGGMLNSNPYIDKTFNAAARGVGQQFSQNVLPGIASMFSGAGRFGSNQMGANVDQAERGYGDTLNNLATSIYGGNYANERGLQNQALGTMGTLDTANTTNRLGAFNQLGDAFNTERSRQLLMSGMTPTLANQDYTDINQLGQLGAGQDQYRQSLLNSDIARWDFGQNTPANKLGTLNSLIQGGLAPTMGRSTTTPSSPFTQFLGNAAMLNAGLGSNGLGLGQYGFGSIGQGMSTLGGMLGLGGGAADAVLPFGASALGDMGMMAFL